MNDATTTSKSNPELGGVTGAVELVTHPAFTTYLDQFVVETSP